MVDDKLRLSGRDSLNAFLGLFSSGVYIDWQCLQKKSWKLLKTMKTKTKIENNKRLVARKKKFIFFFRLTRNAVSVYRNFLNLFKFLELCKQFTNKVWRKDRHTGLDNLTMSFDFPDLKNWVITEKKKIIMLGGIQSCRLHLERRGAIKTRRYPNRREGGLYQCKHSHITFFLLST